MRFTIRPAHIGALLLAAWCAAFALEALQRWRFERLCAMVCGPFWEPALVEPLRRAMDWRSPLALAALPLVVLAVLHGWRAIGRR